jgi:hypothetical protein
MVGEFEAIGDAVTGGLLAHVVEPRAGEAGADGHTFALWTSGSFPSRIYRLFVRGGTAAVASGGTTEGFVLPMPHGRLLCGGSYLWTDGCKYLGPGDHSPLATIPTTSDAFFVLYNRITNGAYGNEVTDPCLYRASDQTRVCSLPPLPEIRMPNQYEARMTPDKFIHLMEEAKQHAAQ